MNRKIAYLILIFVTGYSFMFSQEQESPDVPIELFYYFDSELGKLDKEIAVLEAEYKETLSLAALTSLKQKKLKKEVLNIYGSKAVKRSTVNLNSFTYFSASESFLKKQKELEEKYDIKINISADEQTLEEIKGLGTKVLKTVAKNESSVNNRRIDIDFHAYLNNYSVGYNIKFSEVLVNELSDKASFEEKIYDLNSGSSSNELATAKFMAELETYLRVLRVKLDAVGLAQLWELRNAPDSTITFMTPAGKPFTLLLNKLSKVAFSYNDADIQTPENNDFFADGALQSFTYNNINYGRCRLENHKEVFTGYFANVSTCTGVLNDTLSKKLPSLTKVVVVYACVINGELKFRANKVPVSSSVTWPSVNHSGSGTFQQSLPVEFSGLSLPTVTLSGASLTSTYSAGSKRFLEALNICDRDYIPHAITVANLITLYPNILSQCYSLDRLINDFDLSKHLSSAANNSAPQSRTPLEQYQDKVVMLLQRVKELQGYANATSNTDNQTKALLTANAVKDYVNESSNICALNFISNTERIRLLKILAIDNGNGTHDAIVRLFETLNLEVSDAGTIAFFDALTDPSNNCNGKSLITKIYSIINLSDYSQLNKVLCIKFKSKEAVIRHYFPSENDGEFKMVFYYDDSYLLQSAPIGTHKYSASINDNGSITISKQVVDYQTTEVLPGDMGGPNTHVAHWTIPVTFTLPPFTPITLVNRSSLSSIAEASPQSTLTIAPALFLKFAVDKTFNDDVLRTSAVAMDVISLTTGPGLVWKACRLGRMGLALYEGAQVVGSLANLTSNTLPPTSDVKKWIDEFNVIVAVWGGARLLTNPKVFNSYYFSHAYEHPFEGLDKAQIQNLLKNYTLNKNKLAAHINDANTSKKVDEIVDYLGGMVKMGSLNGTLIQRLESSLFKELKIKYTSLDEISKNKFLIDFEKASNSTLSGLNSDLELVDVWMKWGSKGIFEIDILKAFKKVWKKNVRGVTFDDFYVKTSYQIGKANDQKFSIELFEAWETGYATRNVIGMQNVYRKFGLDPSENYPPCDGVWGVTEIRAPREGEIFDRFQTQSGIGGSYASPLSTNEAVYTLESRALMENYQQISQSGGNYYYFKFKIQNTNVSLNFEYGEAMSWFGKSGGAMQIKASIPFHKLGSDIAIIETWTYANSIWSKL